MITYSCGAGGHTPAESTLAKAYFERLERVSDSQTGVVSIPHALVSWTGADGKVETLCKAKNVAKLTFQRRREIMRDTHLPPI